MSITLNCPSCGGKLSVPDNLAGRKVKCPKCATVITAPAADAGAIQEARSKSPAPPADADGGAIRAARPKAAPPPPASAPPPPPAPRRRAEREVEDDISDYDDDASYDRDEAVRAPRSAGGVNGLAIAGMVLGIVGFLMVFIPCIGWFLGIVLGIVGAVLSGIGMASASKAGGGKGMAIAGLVLSILAIVWVPIYVFIVLSMLTAGANQALQQAAKEFKNIQAGGPLQGAPTAPSGKLTLNNGQATLQGNLAANDSRDRARGGSVCKVYTINMVAGKSYQIDMMNAVGMDPYLRLEDANGNNVAQDDDGGGFPNARIVYVCPANGEYRIVATTFLGGTGNFTLQVSEK